MGGLVLEEMIHHSNFQNRQISVSEMHFNAFMQFLIEYWYLLCLISIEEYVDIYLVPYNKYIYVF